MLIRVSIVISALVGLHSYIGLRLIATSDLSMIAEIMLWGSLLLMSAMPIITMAFRVRKIELPSIFIWCAFMSLGVFWILLTFTFLRDVCWWGLRMADALPSSPNDYNHLFFNTNLAVTASAGLALLVGWWEARRTPRLRPVDIAIDDLPAAFHGFTIAHVTDLHIGNTIGVPFVKKVVETINIAQPDIVALTGDIVDCSVATGRMAAQALGDIVAPAYFVTGNHEYYVGVEPWLIALRQIGLRVLQNEHDIVKRDDAQMVIAGVPDLAGKAYGSAHNPDFEEASKGAPPKSIKIVLSHQPRTAAEASQAGYDLQLSGHTHGGQIWPWNFLVRLQQPVVQGLSKIEGMHLWTSRGTGVWGPPLRLVAPSEISLLRLVASNG